MSTDPQIPVTYKAILPVSAMPDLDTSRYFTRPQNAGRSPIDTFLLNTANINKLYLGQQGDQLPPELGAIVVLGYMSAVESYVRSVVTGLVLIDRRSRDAVSALQVRFAAAYHLQQQQMPEALMEELSLSSASNLEKTLTTTIGLRSLPHDVKTSLKTFEKICQVRHCCVHRFGRLGTKNAIDLGFELDTQKHLIDGSFSPSRKDIEEIADALQVTVKTINNFLFSAILERTLDETEKRETWQMTYLKDKQRFQNYYRLFALKSVKPSSPPPNKVYSSFVKDRRQHMEKILKGATMRLGVATGQKT